MIVYDSTSRVSFEGLPKWLRQVNDNAEDVVKRSRPPRWTRVALQL